MAVVVSALLPVFLLIVLGFILKRTLMRLDTQWHGLERLTYYVLFPTLLIQTLVKADLSSVPVAGVGGALMLSALLMSLLAKDFRTANNIGGALLAPTIIVTLIGGMLLPGGAVRPLVIAIVYTIAAALVMRHALRTVTFERLLS